MMCRRSCWPPGGSMLSRQSGLRARSPRSSLPAFRPVLARPKGGCQGEVAAAPCLAEAAEADRPQTEAAGRHCCAAGAGGSERSSSCRSSTAGHLVGGRALPGEGLRHAAQRGGHGSGFRGCSPGRGHSRPAASGALAHARHGAACQWSGPGLLGLHEVQPHGWRHLQGQGACQEALQRSGLDGSCSHPCPRAAGRGVAVQPMPAHGQAAACGPDCKAAMSCAGPLRCRGRLAGGRSRPQSGLRPDPGFPAFLLPGGTYRGAGAGAACLAAAVTAATRVASCSFGGSGADGALSSRCSSCLGPGC